MCAVKHVRAADADAENRRFQELRKADLAHFFAQQTRAVCRALAREGGDHRSKPLVDAPEDADSGNQNKNCREKRQGQNDAEKALEKATVSEIFQEQKDDDSKRDHQNRLPALRCGNYQQRRNRKQRRK